MAARLLTTQIPFALLVPSDLAPRIPQPDQFESQPDLAIDTLRFSAMFVIIIIFLLLTELCAGGFFAFSPAVPFYLPFFSSSPWVAQNIVRG